MTAPDPPAHHGGPIARTTGRWLVKLRWFVIGGWATAVLASLFVLPALPSSGGSSGLEGLVPSETPAVVNELRSVDLFGFPLLGRTALVQRDPDGLSVYDQGRTAVAATAVTRRSFEGLNRIEGALPLSNAFGVFPSSRERNTTAITYLLFRPDVSLGVQTRQAQRYGERFFGPRDSVVGVSGSVPARAAQGDLIRDNLPLAELLTLLAIVLIVGVAMRSVVAPLVAVLSAGVAYVMTLRISGALTTALGVSSPSELEPVVVALLLGVVTDYVIFYLTAMRRELRKGRTSLDAAQAAATTFGPIVMVAGLAVAAGTGALLVAESTFFRALGPALIFTVLVGLVVAVTLVPALMAVLGRWCFWPDRPDRAADPEAPARSEGAEGSASPDEPASAPAAPRVTALITWLTASRRRAGMVTATCVAGLLLAATPLLGLSLGVSFVGSLPAETGVARAAEAARTGFAPGILSPTTLLIEGEGLDRQGRELTQLGELLEDRPGVAGVLGPGDVTPRLVRDILVKADGTAARYLVVLDDPALGADAISTLDALDDDLDSLLASSGVVSSSAGFAGDTATATFIVGQTTNDLQRLALAALGANLLMLVLFLRAVVAALYLLVGSVLSLGAALGLTMLVFGELDPGAGLTFYVPFAAAVLLLAFGSDYNIFAVGSVWEHARRHPLRESVRSVLPTTIVAIFVAGLALAASFGILSVVPLVPFRQLAFVMAVGIMIDVLVVRSLLLPALLTLFGTASAWPSSQLAGARSDTSESPDGDESDGAERAATTGRSAGSPGS